MAVSEPYHIGILVFDLERGMADFSELLGIEFEVPRSIPVDGRQSELSGAPSEWDLRLCISVSGPMCVELIEAQPDGIWGRQHGEGFHHFGVWKTDLEATLRGHELLELPTEAIVRAGGPATAPTAMYMAPGGKSHNTRIEFVKPRLGVLPPGAAAGYSASIAGDSSI
jgi:hypothetical protein